MSYTAAEIEVAAHDHYASEGFGLTFGVFILAYGADLFLLGLMSHQLVSWYPKSRDDKLWLRSAVWWCVALCLAMSVYNIHWIFELFVYNYGTFSTFFTLTSYSWYIIFDLLTTTVVQMIYAERAYRINNRSKIVLVLIILTCIGTGLAVQILCVNKQMFWTFEDTAPFYLWLGAVMATDLLITASIVVGLRRARTGWEDTDKVIIKLIRLSGQVQLPATIVSIMFIVAYAIKVICSIDFLCQLLQPKVHVVGLLALLNSRDSLREQLTSFQNSMPLHEKPIRLQSRSSTATATTSDFEMFDADRDRDQAMSSQAGTVVQPRRMSIKVNTGLNQV